MLDRLKRFRIAILAVVVIGVVGLIIFEMRMQVFRSASAVERTALMERTSIQIVVTPEHAPDFLHRVAEEQAGRTIPRFLFDRFLAHEFGLLISDEGEDGFIHLSNYLSMPRSANFLARQASQRNPQERVSEIAWTADGVHSPQAGLVVLEGTVEPDLDASEAVFFQWGEGRSLSPLRVTGDHLFELVFDNRSGQAYLAMASVMAAFDFELNPNDTDITLSSFQFVITARMFVDVVEDDVFEIGIDIDIEPEARNRMGVINMKGGIDEAFAELGKRLQRDRGVTVSGGSEWNEFTIEYRYRIDKASTFVDALLDRA